MEKQEEETESEEEEDEVEEVLTLCLCLLQKSILLTALYEEISYAQGCTYFCTNPVILSNINTIEIKQLWENLCTLLDDVNINHNYYLYSSVILFLSFRSLGRENLLLMMSLKRAISVILR